MRFFSFIVFLAISVSAFSQGNKRQDSLTRALETIYNNDQVYRLQWESNQKKYGLYSPEMRVLINKMNTQDSINLLEIRKIINTYGWLSAEETSQEASDAIFLVIQHAKAEVQLTFLPVMKKAVEEKKAKAAHYAYLVDRTNVSQGKLQVYGSQVSMDLKGNYHVYPVYNEPDIDKRRTSVGLPPMAEYLKLFNKPVSYVIPAQDRYHGKIVITGFIATDSRTKPLAGVSIFAGNTYLGTSDSVGFFEVVADMQLKGKTISFTKKGYKTHMSEPGGDAKQVFELNPSLEKQ